MNQTPPPIAYTPGPQQHTWQPPYPAAATRYQTGGYTPYPVRQPGPPLSQRISAAAERGLIGRILAGIGVAITLSGVVMLLVLAAQAGLLRPDVRVAGGGALAAILIGLGVILGRDLTKRPGAVALVATGVAALLFDALATSTVYQWLPPVAVLAISGVIAAVGLSVAHRWNSQPLGLMVSVPVLVLAPVVAAGDSAILVGFMVTYAAVTTWIQVGRDWTALYIVNTAAMVIPAAVFAYDSSYPWTATVLALAGAAAAAGSSVLVVRSSTRPELLALCSGSAVVPLLYAVHGIGRPAAGMLAVGAAIYAAAAFGTTCTTGRDTRIMWLLASTAQLLFATGYLVDTAYQPSTMLGAAAVLAVASYVARDLAEALRVIAMIAGGIGVLMLGAFGAAAQLFVPVVSTRGTATSLALGSVLGLVTVAFLTWSWATTHRDDAVAITITAGTIGLWFTSTGCVSVAHLVTTDATAAFRAGHAAATIIWGAVAMFALLKARRLDGSSRAVVLTAGLGVMAAAIAKLFLFDLAALDGVFRTIAFIVVGLMLLGLGVSYAQALTTDDQPATDAERSPTAV